MGEWPWNWQASPIEQAAEYPCDQFVTGPVAACFRATDAAADPAEVFRWICQLRVAPYSYDLLDNFGRTSPRRLVPDLVDLEVGQTFMTIFRLVDFTPDCQVTLQLHDPASRRIFGDLAVTYLVQPAGSGSRLVAKLVLAADPGALQGARRYLLAWGDLVMMQKQLRTLAGLASHSRA